MARTAQKRQPEALLTAIEVARVLAVSRKSIYRLAATGTLASIRIGGQLRFSPSDLDAFLTAQQGASAKPVQPRTGSRSENTR